MRGCYSLSRLERFLAENEPTHLIPDEHLEDDVQLLPPGPLVLLVVKLVQSDHWHQFPFLLAGHIVWRVQHFAAVQNLSQTEER